MNEIKKINMQLSETYEKLEQAYLEKYRKHLDIQSKQKTYTQEDILTEYQNTLF